MESNLRNSKLPWSLFEAFHFLSHLFWSFRCLKICCQSYFYITPCAWPCRLPLVVGLFSLQSSGFIFHKKSYAIHEHTTSRSNFNTVGKNNSLSAFHSLELSFLEGSFNAGILTSSLILIFHTRFLISCDCTKVFHTRPILLVKQDPSLSSICSPSQNSMVNNTIRYSRIAWI